MFSITPLNLLVQLYGNKAFYLGGQELRQVLAYYNNKMPFKGNNCKTYFKE